MTKNNSQYKDYYTQRNNEIEPEASCNVTAMVQALSVAGWPLPKGRHKQPEDNLMDFIRHDKTVLKKWRRIDPQGKYPPNQWHDLLCLGTNLWLDAGGIEGAEYIALLRCFGFEDFKALIDRGGAAVFSGRFKTRRGSIGHIVAGVGYYMGREDEGILIDDPYGDYHSKYSAVTGNDVAMPKDDFVNLLRPLGKEEKLAHYIPRFYERRKLS